MRATILVFVPLLLLAGCSTPGPDSPAAPAAAVVAAASSVDLAFSVASGMRMCAGPVCSFNGADIPTFEFPKGNYTAFDLNATVAQDFVSQQLSPQRPVEFDVVCHPAGHGGCAGWKNVQADGAFPVHIAASGFRVGPKDQIVFSVKYVGSDPTGSGGSGCSYDVAGTATGYNLSSA